MPSGRIHRKGTEATFSVNWLVTAMNRITAHADQATHASRRASDGGGASLALAPSLSAAAAELHTRRAASAASTTNSTKAAFHASACSRTVRNGSKSTG